MLCLFVRDPVCLARCKLQSLSNADPPGHSNNDSKVVVYTQTNVSHTLSALDVNVTYLRQIVQFFGRHQLIDMLRLSLWLDPDNVCFGMKLISSGLAMRFVRSSDLIM